MLDSSKELRHQLPHSCYIELKAIYDSLKTAEKKAANVLIEEPLFLKKATITEAAEKAGCSEATFTRLAKRLGYAGYPDLKKVLVKNSDQEDVVLYDDINNDDNPLSVVNKVFNSSLQALRDTMEMIDHQEYLKSMNLLKQARKIMVIGVGDAASVAASAYQKFIRIGIDVQMSQDTDVQLIMASMLTEKDVLLAISHSGKTKTVYEAVKLAKKNKAKVISITNYPVSPLTKKSDVILRTAAFREYQEGEIMSKRITELCIIESLYINLLLACGNDCSQTLKKTNEGIEKNKIR